MKVVILAGGLGTRLREETEYRPKPMVHVGGRPILWHIMKTFAHFGLKEFLVCLGYRGELVKEYFLNYEAMNNDFTIRLGRGGQLTYHNQHDEQDFEVTLLDTGLETMTGGRVRRAIEYLADGEDFIVTYGDGLADIDIQALVRFHNDHGRIATVSAVRPVSRFGLMELDNEMVTKFSEKPTLSSWSSAGFFVLKPQVIDYLGGDDTVLEEDPIRRLASEGELLAYKHTGSFHVMDTYREYLLLNELWNTGNPPWKVW